MYGRAFAIFQTIFYLLNLTFWSLFTIIPPKREKYIYNLPTDIWRIFVGFNCLAFLFIQIVEEFTELRSRIFQKKDILLRKCRLFTSKTRNLFQII